MEGTPAIYLGRLVSKDNFRAFIYAPNGGQRLVESWEEFQANMKSGVWFATLDDAKASIAVTEDKSKSAPRTRKSRAKKPVGVLNMVTEMLDEEDEIKEDVPEDAAFEVTDDFLPKG